MQLWNEVWALEKHPAPLTPEQPPNPSTGLYLLLISARNYHSSPITKWECSLLSCLRLHVYFALPDFLPPFLFFFFLSPIHIVADTSNLNAVVSVSEA